MYICKQSCKVCPMLLVGWCFKGQYIYFVSHAVLHICICIPHAVLIPRLCSAEYVYTFLLEVTSTMKTFLTPFQGHL